MDEAPENGKELSHSEHANGMNELWNVQVPDVFNITISFSSSSLTFILWEVLYVSFGLHTNRIPMNTLLHLLPNLLFLTVVLNSGCYRLAFSKIMHRSLHYLCLPPGPG